MKLLPLRSLAVLAFLSLAAIPANATILTFDVVNQTNYGHITTYGTRVNSLSDADGSYAMGNAFTPHIVTSYRTVNPATNGTVESYVDSWNTGYGDLTNVAFSAVSGNLAEVTLKPDAGYAVTLNSFDLAGYFEQDYRSQPVVIYDENYNILKDYTPKLIEGSGPAHTSFAPALTHAGTIHIQFSNTWNVGIDNVNFDEVVRSVATPEPSTLISGTLAALAGLVIARRRSAKV